MPRTLLQIPVSHNCTKVRDALKRKGLAFDTVDIHPMKRAEVRRASGQGLVPVLVDDGEAIPDSTRILLHLEERYPEPPLIPTEIAAAVEVADTGAISVADSVTSAPAVSTVVASLM